MFDKLRALKAKGYVPDTILDIGAYKATWTQSMRPIYPDANYYLFEAIEYPELTQYAASTSNVTSYNVVLNDKVDKVCWYQKKNTGDSMFIEKTKHFVDCEVLERDTIDLDTFISENHIVNDASHIFIKIDCQGAEIPILKGSSSILKRTDFVLIEMPFFGTYNQGVPTYLEHIAFMDSIGFVPYDILESHYINGFNMQIDMLFINKNHSFTSLVNTLLL